ncbi:MAG: 50S ribosomal protein L18 [Spirochaetales bacterium]|nr:50S ribosomal protein L18 [Spirochaetales bacterium]
MRKMEEKTRRRYRRRIRIRRKVRGITEKPRMTIYKSNKYIYIQVIDDKKGHTIASASNKEKEFIDIKSRVKDAGRLGEIIGKRLKEKNISGIVFDRNGYKYHGIIKVIADATRKAGIHF